MGDFVERALGGGKADALEAAAREMFEAFQRKSEMRAAFGGSECVDFVEDDGFDGTEGFAGVGSEQEIERFGCGDQNVGGMAEEAGAFGGRRVSGADGDGGLMVADAEALGGVGDAD